MPGIEAVLPRAAEAGRFRRLLGRHGFQFIAQIVTRGATVREHITSFRQQVRAASTWQPVVINTHSGSDTWSDSEASAYFSEVLRVERDIRCPVAHETHRSRLLFHPLQTRRLVEEFPDLKLCCDFSHWVCVCERLLEDQRRVIALCAERAWHVHARVGYPQGPQVSDPRARIRRCAGSPRRLVAAHLAGATRARNGHQHVDSGIRPDRITSTLCHLPDKRSPTWKTSVTGRRNDRP